MARQGLADRLYRGEANLNIGGRRKIWFTTAGVLVLIGCAFRQAAARQGAAKRVSRAFQIASWLAGVS